jgi:hypothetical protein
MANTLTSIINSVWAPLTSAPKEPRGALDAIAMDIDNTPVDIGQPLVVSVVATKTSGEWTPRMYETAQGDATPTTISLSLAGAETVFNLSDAERGNLMRTGDVAYESFFQQNIQQCLRANSATVGAAAITALKTGSSRATGTAGITPFASDTSELENALYELKRNGAPMSDLACVMSSSAYRNFRALGIVQQAQINGGSEARKMGLIGKESGFDMFEDFSISATTSGAMAGFQLDATLAVNSTTLTFDGGTVNTTGCVAGDVITIGSGGGTGTADTNKYVVKSGSTSTSGSIVIGGPGLLLQHVDNDEITIGSAYTPSFAFSRSALKAVVRPVSCNVGGQVVGVSPILDQYGLPATLIEIRGTGMSVFSVVQAYGFKVIKNYGVVTILG